VTPGIDSLLSADADDGDWRSPAIIGGPWESDGSLALGFFKLADIAVEWWKAGHRNDALVIPIIYSYRHGIELALKEEIREAAACLRRDGVAGPDAQADEVDQWLSGIHSIEQLVNRLTKLLGQLKLGPGQQLPAETLDVLRKLHVLARPAHRSRLPQREDHPRAMPQSRYPRVRFTRRADQPPGQGHHRDPVAQRARAADPA